MKIFLERLFAYRRLGSIVIKFNAVAYLSMRQQTDMIVIWQVRQTPDISKVKELSIRDTNIKFFNEFSTLGTPLKI